MIKFIKNSIGVGLGTAMMVKRASERLFSKIADQGKISRREGEKILEGWTEAKDRKKDHLEKEFERRLEKVLRKMHIPTRSDYEMLEKRIRMIEKTLAKPNTLNE